MSASISDPFLLSSYALPARLSPLVSSSASGQRLEHVLISQRLASSGERIDDFVTVAVQGDGVHVLDLSTLHPAISHTLGPSTTFACPPVSRTTTRNGTQTCTTFAIVASSPEVNKEDQRRTVWTWDEPLSGGVMTGDASKNKKVAVMPHPVSRLYVLDDIPDRIIIVDERGAIAIADTDLNIQRAFAENQSSQPLTLHGHLVFPRDSCSFIPTRIASQTGVIAISFTAGEHLTASLSAISPSSEINDLGEVVVPIDASLIAEVSFSPAGYFTVLTHSGVWHAFRLSLSQSSSFVLTTPTEPLALSALSFISPLTASTSTAATHQYRSERALLGLTSSHVLLAGITYVSGDGPEVCLLLWDMQYGVLLAEQRCAVPSTLGRSKQRGISMQLVSHSQGQTLLVLSPSIDPKSPTNVDNSQNPMRTNVLVVPYIVPETSTIAGALGRAAAGAKWLKSSATKGPAYANDQNRPHTQLFNSIRTAMDKKDTAVAENLFEQWVQAEAKETGANAILHPNNTDETGTGPHLEYTFVQHLLSLVLHVPADPASSTKHASLLHAPNIIRYLLERHAVSDGMVPGGLLPALMSRNDWQSAVLAIRAVNDLPEADVISLLAKVASHHRRTVSDDNAMDVDFTSGIPSLPSLLALCVTYSMSPAALRVALHQHISEADDLVCILQVLDGWIERWCQEEVKLLPDRVKKDAYGVPVPVYEKHTQDELPPLDKTLDFVQSILDSSFLILLAHRPAHSLLRQLLSRLQPEVAYLSDLQALYGPLQPFAAAHARAVHDGVHGPPKVDTQVDWRRRKKAAHERHEMALGVYQVEELVI